MAAIVQALKDSLPPSLRRLGQRAAQRLRHYGFAHYCPVCGSHLRQFLPRGEEPNAVCPFCKSQERHRLLRLYFQREVWLFSRTPMRLLHVAPEPGLGEFLAALPNVEYLSADLASPDAMVRMDITRIEYPDESFGAILCNHVLEHVPDDRKAMREFFRVLSPGGWAVLLVPYPEGRETTYEDWSIQTPEGRQKAFGQSDHVRIYGRDYKDRLESAGFAVKVDHYAEANFTEREIQRMRLQRKPIFLCQKPGS